MDVIWYIFDTVNERVDKGKTMFDACQRVFTSQLRAMDHQFDALRSSLSAEWV